MSAAVTGAWWRGSRPAGCDDTASSDRSVGRPVRRRRQAVAAGKSKRPCRRRRRATRFRAIPPPLATSPSSPRRPPVNRRTPSYAHTARDANSDQLRDAILVGPVWRRTRAARRHRRWQMTTPAHEPYRRRRTYRIHVALETTESATELTAIKSATVQRDEYFHIIR